MKTAKVIQKILTVYMVLPILIFILGWIKPFISVPATILISIMAYRFLKDESFVEKTPIITKRDIETLVLAGIIIALWVYLSGIGKLVYQNWDHIFRNSIFEMLVNNDWPVIKTFQLNGSDTPLLFVYYLGFWMPAAIVGKLFGITAGYFFQVFWAWLGVWLFYWLVCCFLKRISLLPLVILIFFSGLDALGTAILSGTEVSLFSGTHIEWWAGMQFSSFTTQLFWVFNQAIPGWILTILVLTQDKNRYIVFLLGISLIFCPLPFIGVLPFVGFVFLRNLCKSSRIKAAIADLFSIENVLGGGISGILTYIYFKANASGQHIVFVPANSSQGNGYFFNVFLFLLLEVGVYVIAIYKYQRRNPLLYIAFIYLCTCPLFDIGYGGDYCMRACIPAQVVVYLLVVMTIYESKYAKDKATVIALTVLLIVGAITSVHEINRTVQNTIERFRSNIPVYGDTLTEEELMMGEKGTNFRGDALESIFCRYLAR
jgi:putative uncharacterized protein FNV0213